MTLNWPIIILCAVGISLLLTLVLVPAVIKVSQTKRLFDRPNSRKIHTGHIPRLGGFAFLPVMLVTLSMVFIMPAAYSQEGPGGLSSIFFDSLPDLVVVFGTMTVMFLTGLYDDLQGLKYGVKFLTQIACAVMLVQAGVYIGDFHHLFGIEGVTSALGKVIAGFLVVYIINGLNLIDGIDGLASGLCVIALSFFGTVCYLDGMYVYSLLAWTGAASLLVFWFFNVCGSVRKGTKIFMGDVGSLSVGVFLAFLMLEVGRQPSSGSVWGINPIVLAFSPLVLPLFDVVRVFFVRIMSRKSPFLPDKTHIHHILLDAGMPMGSVMCCLLLLEAAFIALNMVSEYMDVNVVLILDVALYAIVVVAGWAFKKNLKENKRNI